MPSVCLPAFAKVNLCLQVLGKRPDGYHELRTIFQSIGLHDTLTLTLQRRPRIELDVSGDPGLAATPSRENLVYRALDLLRRELRLRSGVRVELEKLIPVGRGLGGGSSDAAAALRGMLRLTGRKLPAARLIELAASLGADVPFFLFGGRALGVSRGDEIYTLPDLPARSVVVVSPPDIGVSTRDAYRWLGQRRPSLRLTKSGHAPKLWSFCALCWSLQGGDVSNDFEAAVFRRYPRLGRIKRGLLEQGAAEAALAGSGSAVFALFRSPAQARRAAEGFLRDQVFICATLSREEYRRAQQLRAGA